MGKRAAEGEVITIASDRNSNSHISGKSSEAAMRDKLFSGHTRMKQSEAKEQLVWYGLSALERATGDSSNQNHCAFLSHHNAMKYTSCPA